MNAYQIERKFNFTGITDFIIFIFINRSTSKAITLLIDFTVETKKELKLMFIISGPGTDTVTKALLNLDSELIYF